MRATDECREEVETNRRDDEKIASLVAIELSCFASSIAALNLDELGHLGIVMDSEADREPLHFGQHLCQNLDIVPVAGLLGSGDR
jgi:hypothetical protein